MGYGAAATGVQIVKVKEDLLVLFQALDKDSQIKFLEAAEKEFPEVGGAISPVQEESCEGAASLTQECDE